MYRQFGFWIALLLVAAFLDVELPQWINSAVQARKIREHAEAAQTPAKPPDDPTPAESDRSVTETPDRLLALASDGTRFYIRNGSLVTVNQDDRVLWSRDLQDQQPVFLIHPTQPIVFVAAADGLHALDIASGAVRWSIADGQWRIRSLTVTPRGDICGAGRQLRCIDESGEERWRSREPSDQGRLLAGHDGELFAADFLQMRVHGPDGGVSRTVGPSFWPWAFDPSGEVIYGLSHGSVSAVPRTGGQLWKREACCQGPFGLVVGKDGTIYVSTNKLMAFAPDGASKWVFETPDELIAEPMLDINGDVLVAGNRRLFAVNARGELVWRADLGARAAGPIRLVAVDARHVYASTPASDFFIERPGGPGTR